MEWIERLNQAVNYIEENLDGSIDYNEAAKLACCTTFHFQRMFSYIAGVPLSEYIRRRRMTRAAADIKNSSIQIVDLAAKYGYDSPTSFSRAFKSVHGFPPSGARQKGVFLNSYPKLVFSLSVKGSEEIRYRIEEKPEFRVVGKQFKLNLDLEGNFSFIPSCWAEFKKTKDFSVLCGMIEPSLPRILGVTEYTEPDSAFYTIAAAADIKVPEGLIERTVPAATWVVFECSGPYPDTIQNLYRRFYTEWLPFSGYEYAQTYDLEVYPPANDSNSKTEVWFAVKSR